MAESQVTLISSHYANNRNLQFSLIAVVPSWLRAVSIQIIESAKNYASRFGSKNRKFSYAQTGSPNEFTSTITCEGLYVEATAFDLKFTVPVDGFKPGDIDPITGEPFPTGRGKHGEYIILENKPEAEGEAQKAVARTYSKYSGRTITMSGFFSRALEKNIGSGIMLSTVGKRNLETLALRVGVEMAHAIGNQIKFECAARGLSVSVQGPDIITTIT